MGRECAGAGKYVHFCIAALIFLTLIGCTLTKRVSRVDIQMKEEASEDALPQKPSVPEQAVETPDEKGMPSLSTKAPPEDEALFKMGLSYAHPANPQRDYTKSLGFFKKLLNDFPESALAEQTKAWIAVLQENRKLGETVEKLNEMIEKSKQVDFELEEKKRTIVK